MMIGRIVRPVDFERALAQPTRSRSTHFAAHHLATRPAVREKPAPRLANPELSTGGAQSDPHAVDDVSPPEGCWLGAVVPKRHARRAVTRTLMKRQIREAMARHQEHLLAGLWVVRLKSPFDRKQFPSASSEALKIAVASELDRLFERAQR